MSPHISDDTLRALIGAIHTDDDPVPAELTLAARSAIAWRDIDARIAELLFDSAEADPATSGVRSIGGPRMLSYGSPGLTVELQLESQPHRRLLGQLTPPGPAAVTIRHRDGTLATTADETGAFVVDGVPEGPISVHVQAEDGPPFVTDWIVG